MTPRRRRYRGPLIPRLITLAVLGLIAAAFARAGVQAYRELPAVIHPATPRPTAPPTPPPPAPRH